MPKRSAGCFECRKRKVRCDETKPECNTCLRRGTKCPGYRPPQSFILHKFDDQAERPALIKEDENSYKYANQNTDTSPTQKSPPARAVARLPASQHKPVDAPVPRQVSPIAIDRVQHLGTFIALYLPSRGGALPPPSALILALPTMPATSGVLLASIDALSAAQLAVNNKNLPLINRSRSLYGTALTQMLKAIQDPKTALQDETLLSTYLMTLYEVFVGVTQGHGFFYHVQGLLHLLRQRGPSSFNTRLSMQIFHAIRYNSLSIGYHLRRASMLDSPEWLAVTYKAAKFDPYIALLDLCICIPRLLERSDKLSIGGPPSEEEVDKLLSDARFHADRAFDWFKDFQKDGPRYEKVDVANMEGFLEICPDRTFDPVFDFHNFAAGICYMIYWMSMLIMQSNTFKLYRQYRKLEPKQLMMWDRELSGYADRICRSVPYNCRQATGYTARFGSLTPLVVARKYFEAKGAKAESQWCEMVYLGARVPGLYSAPVPLEPLKGVKPLIQNNNRYI